MNDEVNCQMANTPKGMPADLARFLINAVFIDQTKVVLKNSRRKFECNAMTGVIQTVLTFVPLKVHSVYTQCTWLSKVPASGAIRSGGNSSKYPACCSAAQLGVHGDTSWGIRIAPVPE